MEVHHQQHEHVRRPLLFQISPINVDLDDPAEANFEDTQRFCELLHVAKYVAAIEVYRGGHLGTLQTLLNEFLHKNRANPFPLLLALNVHGDNRGSFKDSFLGTPFDVTPDILWNGDAAVGFLGIGCLVENWSEPVSIYLGQCFGGHYGKHLEVIVRASRYRDVEIVGGSTEETFSEFTTNSQMENASVHERLTEFCQIHFEKLPDEKGVDGRRSFDLPP